MICYEAWGGGGGGGAGVFMGGRALFFRTLKINRGGGPRFFQIRMRYQY